MGFCAVYRPPRTPYGMLKSGIFTVCVGSPRLTTYKKLRRTPPGLTGIFAKNVFFFNFSRCPLKYPTSAYISGIYAFTEERLISTDLVGAASNYGLSVFLPSY